MGIYNLYECKGKLYVDSWRSCDVIKVESIKNIDLSSFEISYSENNIAILKIRKDTLELSDNEKISILITHEFCTDLGSCGYTPRHISNATFLIFTALSDDYLTKKIIEKGAYYKKER